MATWTLDPSRTNLHGYFSRDLPPVLTIDSGDTVVFQTLDAAWNVRSRRFEGDEPVRFADRDPDRGDGHCLNGPIAIRGAEPGTTLEIRIDSIRVGSHGWTTAGGWPHEVHKRLGFTDPPEAFLYWTLDPDTNTGRDQLGHTIDLHPFMGVMGMPPDEPGRHPTHPPRVTGGNLDCKELVAGTSLFLPVAVPGGLFSVGDGHAAQGDGEICVTAIECPMERVELTFFLHSEMRISAPRAKTKDSWVTLGVHEDLD